MICELQSKRQCPQLCVFSKQQQPTQEIFSTCLTSVSLSVLLWQLQIQQLEVVPTITSQSHWPVVQIQCGSAQSLLWVIRTQIKESAELCSFLEVFWGNKCFQSHSSWGPSRFHETVTWVPIFLLAVGKVSFLLLKATHTPGLTAQAYHSHLQTLHLSAFLLGFEKQVQLHWTPGHPGQSPSSKVSLLSVICPPSSTCNTLHSSSWMNLCSDPSPGAFGSLH